MSICKDTLELESLQRKKITQGVHPAVMKVITEADRLAVIRAHAAVFVLNMRKDMMTRFQGLLLLPLINSWQDCLNAQAELCSTLSAIESQKAQLLSKCTRLRAEHRKPFRTMQEY